VAAVLHAPDYAREEGLPYTALMETPITPARAREAVAWVQSYTNCAVKVHNCPPP